MLPVAFESLSMANRRPFLINHKLKICNLSSVSSCALHAARWFGSHPLTIINSSICSRCVPPTHPRSGYFTSPPASRTANMTCLHLGSNVTPLPCRLRNTPSARSDVTRTRIPSFNQMHVRTCLVCACDQSKRVAIQPHLPIAVPLLAPNSAVSMAHVFRCTKTPVPTKTHRIPRQYSVSLHTLAYEHDTTDRFWLCIYERWWLTKASSPCRAARGTDHSVTQTESDQEADFWNGLFVRLRTYHA